ncbi:MAG: hypothetical protein AB7K68_06565 [Bacteriovoracia bacterium]
METQNHQWLPLTEYALRSGMSISTLRRKIKSNSIHYKMEDGRYLIQSDKFSDHPSGGASSARSFSSSDERPMATPIELVRERTASLVRESSEEASKLAEELRQYKSEDSLRWRALEARVSGLAKKLELFTEQMSEVKMLVKIFEEKLDRSV